MEQESIVRGEKFKLPTDGNLFSDTVGVNKINSK